jgi:thiaminase/transcriptional activator TenA
MALSDEARAAADELWEAQHRHPVVRGIATGTLDLDAFGFWVRQDFVFLVDYARVLAFAAARAPDVAKMRGFAEVTGATLGVELEGHRRYAAGFGITGEQLEAEPAAPATRGYLDFLLARAGTGGFDELVAALLPCMWGFSEIGRRAAASVPAPPADPRYAQWLAMYADDEFAALAAWCREVFDAVAAGASPARRALMVETFVTSSRHELAFWDQVPLPS